MNSISSSALTGSQDWSAELGFTFRKGFSWLSAHTICHLSEFQRPWPLSRCCRWEPSQIVLQAQVFNSLRSKIIFYMSLAPPFICHIVSAPKPMLYKNGAESSWRQTTWTLIRFYTCQLDGLGRDGDLSASLPLHREVISALPTSPDECTHS